MKRMLMTAVGCGAIALTLGACESRAEYRAKRDAREALKVISRLDCPETQGDLKRVSAEADGQTCTYSGADAEVTLKLVAVSNEPAKALEPIEAEVRGLFAPVADPAAPETPEPPAKPAEPVASGKTTKETVKFPGVSIETEEGDGVDKARIRVPGVSIDADGENAKVRVAGMEITANEDTNEVRIVREKWRDGDEGNIVIDGADAHIDGDGFSMGGKRKRGFRTTFVKTDETAGAAWTTAGYEAQGPTRGPLVVAVVKSKKPRDGTGSNSLFKDATALVRHNFEK
ncbi:hypothetical protein GVN21_11020 [Caulobacter sp. SLTY]|uniref:hypothetical protein n=1 Tax=Caulobacter sp. SLTY TaxID=2683262 RepID=UPI0014123B8A|nr:hypothetical protein [Caulobacter sp. SLTY]NBB15887.1 hypothetical protein [Caulobacter sp. SLTY]